MNTDTLNQEEVGAVRALAPERGTLPARVVRRVAPARSSGGAAGGAMLAGCRLVRAHPGALAGSFVRAVARLAPVAPG